MDIKIIRTLISDGALKERYSALYSDTDAAKSRYLCALESFESLFGDCDAELFSVPGRSEICGNHTDHNGGCVLAGAIDRDIIAVAARTDGMTVSIKSEGYDMDTVMISDIGSPDNFGSYTSAALIAGVLAGFKKRGYAIGGFSAYAVSDVLKGSGISSSAAYEVMIGNILNHLYNGGKIDNKEIAEIAQYAENVYFGKPSGLMDQMACAVGGFVYIDFSDKECPAVESIDFSLSEHGYSLAIINTGGNHADLNDDYASVPREMRGVAHFFGKEVLSGLSEGEIISNISALRAKVGDRAILRALHFVRENDRVRCAKNALKNGDTGAFLLNVTASGNSSFKYLQNVYTNLNVNEQGLSLALALADGYMSERSGALRVHGGGFAGTVQVLVKDGELAGLAELMDSVFGKGATMCLKVRAYGAIKLNLI